MMETHLANAAASISPLLPRSKDASAFMNPTTSIATAAAAAAAAAGGRRRRRVLLEEDAGQENSPPPSLLIHPNIIQQQSQKKQPLSPNKATINAESAAADDSVKVVVRIRPVNRREREGVRIVEKKSSGTLSIDDRTYTYDSVLGPDSSQEDVFKFVGIPLVKDALAGFNVSILSYGQTGSGKTYTMWGPPSAMVDCHSVNSYQGVVPRIFHMLFSEIQKAPATSEEKHINYQCRCSFLEIYNEQLNDLLDPTQRNLQIKDDARSGFHVENLTEEYVSTVEDVTQILVKGLSNRKVGATSMNCKSSRSHIIFTLSVELWCKGSSPQNFSSSKTSRVTLVDLAGWDSEKLDGFGRCITKEGKNVKRSLSSLGKVVNILAEIACTGNNQNIPYMDSSLTRLLQETLGGNSKITFICAISPNDRQRAGTLSTLRFGERAKLIRNKAVINEITEDHVNGLSDQIRQLKEELLSAKFYRAKSKVTVGAYFTAKNARDSLNLLRASLNHSLILPHVDDDPEEELDIDENDVMELCSLLSNETSSCKAKTKDIKKGKNSIIAFCSKVNSNAKGEDGMDSHLDSPADASMSEDEHYGKSNNEFPNIAAAVPTTMDSFVDSHNGLTSAVDGLLQDSCKKSSRSIVPCQSLPLLQDPTICLSPKIENKLKENSVLSPSVSEKQYTDDNHNSLRSSLKSSKIFPTDSLAASLHRGLQIIDYHQRISASEKSVVGLSFEHLASVSCTTAAMIEARAQTSPDGGKATPLCAVCKRGSDGNSFANHRSSGMQIVAADDTVTPKIWKEIPVQDDNKVLMNAIKSKIELETLCKEQAMMIRQLNYLVDKCKHEHGQASVGAEDQFVRNPLKVSTGGAMSIVEHENASSNLVVVEHELLEENQAEMLQKMNVQVESQNSGYHTTTFDTRKREALVEEIQNLKNQLQSLTHVSTDGSPLDHIRNGSSSPESTSTDYEKERERWTESESKWISLTEELRLDLETNRKLAETKDIELNLEKKCTAELDDALQRSILGHARIIEHYAELQEKHNDLLARHRKVMEGIAEVKKAAAKAGSKGAGKAFAAALAAEISTLRVERERERAFLKEQNKGLRIQLRDTAEAVHAAGELLVRLREAEEAVSVAEEKHGQAKQENEKLRKKVEKMKKKHAMEMETMRHYLAESRLPESALKPFYCQDPETAHETKETFPADDQSWRAAFTPSFQ